jgi:hypothetical protein
VADDGDPWADTKRVYETRLEMPLSQQQGVHYDMQQLEDIKHGLKELDIANMADRTAGKAAEQQASVGNVIGESWEKPSAQLTR